jgi:hypothetical protein
MTPKGADLEATDLIEVSTIESGSYVTRSITGQELIDAIPAPSGFVPTSRTLTINGTTQDLSADRSWTIATGLTIGTTPIASGTIGRVLFQGTGNVLQQSGNLFWDGTNNRLGIGTATPLSPLHVVGNAKISSLAPYLDLTTSNWGTSTFIQNGVNINASSIGDYFNIFNPAGKGFSYTRGSLVDFAIATTGNVLINTTTDAGFKLDVNGTARVQGSATIQTLTVGLGNNSVANNTVVGLTALNVNTTGDYNSAFGGISLQKNTSGNYNTAIGYQTLNNNTSGANNTAIGMQSCNGVTIQSNNTGVGFQSLNSGGANNSALGASTDSGGFSGSVILGRSAVATGANQFVVGSTGTNAGAVTTEVNASTQVWNVIINGVARKILLA